MEPLKAPKRITPPSRDTDNSAIWWVVALGLCVVGGIAWQHLFGTARKIGHEVDANGEMVMSAAQNSVGGGMRKEMKEAPLEKAKALPRESFAGAVSHVQDSAACSELRTTRNRVQTKMRESHSAAQAKEFQLDLKSIRNRGTELGCWSGGAG